MLASEQLKELRKKIYLKGVQNNLFEEILLQVLVLEEIAKTKREDEFDAIDTTG